MTSKGIEQSDKTINRSDALIKFFLFSTAMVIVPISSYYLSLKYVFDYNKTTYAAIIAVLMANAVLIGYIILALMEDRNDRNRGIGANIPSEALKELKKDQ
ncbi:uncharacterized protein T551_03378 [Pneumocystis jirovecii RU7]|uniref:Vacuolar ATPase assembly integral membrane protein VMA21 n=1 Tax=Pneumocystis jirovecii (strain RU7) TaxID=1408657 RepID=A0A0W4ZEV2_PNEJ7|nr:uncharacterized protein T551_03378 [Pneumocystis jirovecii RU7]KTW26916.1 hypothetical protein T551_03378 [Pneumocystis jirovecii RU7]